MTNLLKKSEYMEIKNDEYMLVIFEDGRRVSTSSGYSILDAMKNLIYQQSLGHQVLVFHVAHYDYVNINSRKYEDWLELAKAQASKGPYSEDPNFTSRFLCFDVRPVTKEDADAVNAMIKSREED